MARRVEKGEEKEAGPAEGVEWKLWEALNCIGPCCCPAKPQVFLGDECTIPMDSPNGNDGILIPSTYLSTHFSSHLCSF